MCDDWESIQSFHTQQTNDRRGTLRMGKRAPRHEEQRNPIGNVITLSTNENKSTRRIIKLKDEPLDLQCEWRDCDYRSDNLENFVLHVSLHMPHLEIRVNEAQESVYACLWRSCTFESADPNEITRHVNFHSHHTKIKNIGSNVLYRSRLPVCKLSDVGRNVVPNLPHAFECCWDNCEETFNNPYKYFSHVNLHFKFNRRGTYARRRIQCEWRGCKSVFSSICKLTDHIRSHTQEKVVGCPICGSSFANRSKFTDHCMRQVPSEFKGHQCRQCLSWHANKALLRDHERRHFNRYKCVFCDMTCVSPSALSTHIRYRHLDSKPFKCNFCEYRAKRRSDMKQHLKRHCSDAFYRCEEKGCDFSCRSICVLRRHRNRCHLGNDEPLYCCNMCDSRFLRGSLLTRHLRSKHNISWPSGHCRFKYKRDKNGFFWLETTRSDDVNMTQDVMQSQYCTTPSLLGSSQRVLDYKSDSVIQRAEADRIVISTTQVDKGRNVVLLKELKTKEL
jgi:hypothetical protein